MTLHDLPDSLRESLLRGYFEYHAKHVGDSPFVQALLSTPIADEQAFRDGRRLAEARDMLLSANSADFDADERRYDRVADDLNERYGADLVVGSAEPGLSPGFRDFEIPES